MASRTFENVSPFGALLVNGRTVEHGAVYTTIDAATADGLAVQPLNWRELEQKATAKKSSTKK